MPDRIEQLLNGLEARPAAGEPPAAFLRAVGVKRRRRRLGRAGVVAGVLLVGVGVWAGIRGLEAPRATPGPEIVRVEPPAISLVALRMANRDLDVDALDLPPPVAVWGSESRPLRGGEAGQIDSWLSR